MFKKSLHRSFLLSSETVRLIILYMITLPKNEFGLAWFGFGAYQPLSVI